tara:strand:- start:11620 stop:11823 length:204 start_codon:yes stop_codon:yes gene_type:complete
MDLKKYGEEQLKTYQEELETIQKQINAHMIELDNLKRAEQRLLGAIASTQDIITKEDREKEEKKAKA